MATTDIPLNAFVTKRENLTTANVEIYTAPTGFTSIVLMSQITNVTENAARITAWTRNGATSISTELAKDFDVPGRDATSITVGKLVIPDGDTLILQASANNVLKATISILETSNE